MALPVPPPPPVVGAPMASVNPPAPPAAPAPAPVQAPPAPMAAPVQEAPAAPVIPAPAPAPVQSMIPAAPPAPMQMAVAAEAPAAVPGSGAVLDALAALGYADLELGFGSFSIISLDQGEFKFSDGGSPGAEFYIQAGNVRAKYLIKTALDRGDSRYSMSYSYDGVTNMKGELVADNIAKWAAQGIGYTKLKYLEVFCTMQDGKNVLLSIPPTSIGRMSAALVTIFTRGYQIDQVWIKCSKGPKVTAVREPFFPWAFEPVL